MQVYALLPDGAAAEPRRLVAFRKVTLAVKTSILIELAFPLATKTSILVELAVPGTELTVRQSSGRRLVGGTYTFAASTATPPATSPPDAH
ncbi:hypothetical protein V2W30_36455 [Streptomyces sp. Q6]|uniref:Uncharacterized protein n=1 Tax=Streptomyces citrinus TaxID=3118173 RepID=A0ACD5AM77_9ACTN